ncbi:hypothetical protein CC78DRAFT_455799 [Lojkania enalia]|uniref:Zn(2)-C6 fungal-type domain-containing protein n=1 Tax=Lojkania enalia TaxID=147567 RepID=A0A9P4KJ51_9PLEO|nr:hypothetical protein CC78DRAFT_455799 [Didymosphaeria enalia]
MNPSATRKPVSKACDACRRRKIKCNGLQPCPVCVSSGLVCTFQLIQKRGGNQGFRATVLNELRGSTQDSVATSSREPNEVQTFGNIIPQRDDHELERSIIDTCVHAYLLRIYPVIPFLTREILQHETRHMAHSLVSRQFILSFCAYVVTFGNVLDDLHLKLSNLSHLGLGEQLLDAAIRIQVIERITEPSLQSVFISFFLYGAFAGLGDYRQCWFHLREASTLLMMYRGDTTGWQTKSIYNRLFWVLSISERAHGIRRNRPITLQITPDSPPLQAPDECGLCYLASIFRPFDEAFFAVWNGSQRDCSKEWLINLDREVRIALPISLNLSNGQLANLRVSQLWLRIKLWELFPRFGYLSSESVYECLTFRYPTVIARDLTIVAVKLPIASLQAHGVGMTEKIFDIACALTDILPFVSTSASQLELGPTDYLTQITSLLAKLPGGTSKFVPLLLVKVKELIPGLIVPLCEAVQLPLPSMEFPMSPNSKFVYEDEVRKNLYADLRRGNSTRIERNAEYC